jgi:hypothetical protein
MVQVTNLCMKKKSWRRMGKSTLVAALLYFGSYPLFRLQNTHQWNVSSVHKTTVVGFAVGYSALYYVWLPLHSIDKSITGALPYISSTVNAPMDRCPVCGSEQTHVIYYGYGSEGGCCIDWDSPRVACDRCRFTWKDFNIDLQ